MKKDEATLWAAINLFGVFLLASAGLLAGQKDRPGDPSRFVMHGFSSDGRYAAFQYSWSPVESGKCFSEIVFVDVMKNGWITKPILEEQDWTGPESSASTEKAALESATDTLSAYRITKGNVGENVYERLVSGYNGKMVQEATAHDPSQVRWGNYEVSLQQYPLFTKTCQGQLSDPSAGFELSVTNLKTSEESILQKDTQLPRSQNCAYRYRISSVYVYHNKIVVFLRSFTPGFEGFANIEYVVISGVLPG